MAVTLPGDGAAVATDTVGGEEFQVAKIAFGSAAEARRVTSVDPFPVTGAFVKAEDSPSADGDVGVVILVQRRDTDASAVGADGDYGTMKTDEEGRVKVSTKPGSFELVTGTITASAQTVPCDVSRASNVMLMMNTSALAGHNCAFEGSLDSTNGTDGVWFAIQAVRSNANTIETATGVLAATPAYAWELSVNGLKYLRVRATAHTSGTATWKIQRGSYATEPIPAAQISGTQPVSGSVTANQGTMVTPTAYNLSSTASTNAISIKASAGTVYSVAATNSAASPRYVKLYNKASAPTVGTDVPILTIPVPAGGVVSIPFGATGHRFPTGIAMAVTANAIDTDTTAIGAAEVKAMTSFI